MPQRNEPPVGIERRRLLQGLAAGSLLPLIGGNLLACSDSSDSRPGEDPGVA